MPPTPLLPALEALLFSSDQPLTLALLSESLETAHDAIEVALAELGEAYTARGAGVELREIAGGWMLVTTPAQAEWVGRMLHGKRKMRLSRPALETMAIIAYKQPVTKGEIEAIRGVDSTAVLATLLERNLITIRGRSKVVGRPLLYGTTPEFLDYFGLKDLTELPRPEELRALIAAREPEQLEMMDADVVSQVATDLALAEASAEGRRGAEGVTLGGDGLDASSNFDPASDLRAASDFDAAGDGLDLELDVAGAESDEDEYDDDDDDADDDDADDDDADDVSDEATPSFGSGDDRRS